MQIWLDTIDLDVIEDSVKTGIVCGVTTNPSILSHTENVFETISTLLEIQPGPVAVQVTSSSSEGMVEEGKFISQFSPRMVVKVPINRNGSLQSSSCAAKMCLYLAQASYFLLKRCLHLT